MWYCRTHECWVRRDWNCVKCENVARAAKRREEADEAEEAKKRAKTKAEEEISKVSRQTRGSTISRKVKGSVPKVSRTKSIKWCDVRTERKRDGHDR